MYGLNEKIKGLVPYEPIKGDYDIRLDANESFIDVPEHIKKAIDENVSKLDYKRYPDPLATDVCTAFADMFNLRFENVVAGNGSDELIALLFSGFLMKGEAFATFDKDFSMYRFYGSLSECESILLNKNADFTINVDKTIEMCKNKNVKLLIFSNPCNPTSLGLNRADVCKIIESLPDCLVIVDEAYMDFWDNSVLDKINDYDNLLILKTCSKAFGMAGLRVGFAIGNETLIRAIKAIKSPYNLNLFSQCMAATVLSFKDDLNDATQKIIASKNDLYAKLLGLGKKYNLEILESDTNFVVVKTEKSEAIYKFLLDEKIAIRCFGSFLRITAGTDFENTKVISSLEAFFA